MRVGSSVRLGEKSARLVTLRASVFGKTKAIDRKEAADVLRLARKAGAKPAWFSRFGRYGSNRDAHGYRIASGPFVDWATLYIEEAGAAASG